MGKLISLSEHRQRRNAKVFNAANNVFTRVDAARRVDLSVP